MWARDRLYSLNEAAFLFRHFSVKSSCIWCIHLLLTWQLLVGERVRVVADGAVLCGQGSVGGLLATPLQMQLPASAQPHTRTLPALRRCESLPFAAD